jgi:hypothetical protein
MTSSVISFSFLQFSSPSAAADLEELQAEAFVQAPVDQPLAAHLRLLALQTSSLTCH